MDVRSQLEEAQRIVVKIGSAVFLRGGDRVDRTAFASLVEGLDALIGQGRSVTIVSSGAVAMGRQWLGEEPQPTREIPRLQALAATGQSRLMQMWEAEFSHYNRKVAQILFSRDDLSDRTRYLNARRTLRRLEDFGAIPVINENDTVATEELRFGDNDELAAMTAGLIGADALVLLSDVEGLKRVDVDDDGKRHYGRVVDAIDVDDPRVERWAGPSDSDVGTGGMISKVRAAEIAARSGVITAIAPGKRPGVLQEVVDGAVVGTAFRPRLDDTVAGRKVWLGAGAMARGTVVCDAGARRAVLERGASLLPSGVLEVRGDFDEGQVVEIEGEDGTVFARGLSVYGADDLQKIAGEHSSDIESVLGFKVLDEVVHRDNLVTLE